jgi:capsular polysaccharide transport system permease protein
MSDASKESPAPSFLDARKGTKGERSRPGRAPKDGPALRAVPPSRAPKGNAPRIAAVPSAGPAVAPVVPVPSAVPPAGSRHESMPPEPGPVRPLPPRPGSGAAGQPGAPALAMTLAAVPGPAAAGPAAGRPAALGGAAGTTQPGAPRGPVLVPPPSAPPSAPPVPPAGAPSGPAPARGPGEGPAVGATARPARVRGRHVLLVLSFLVLVAAPIGVTAWYLWTRAVDQYASTVGFSVRREEGGSAMDLLGGITAITGSSSSDTDILYEFLRSQELVARLDAELDLRAIWSKPEDDPVFALDPDGTIEDLVAYWHRMVRIGYDSNSGLIEIRALAFDPADATRITQALFDRSAEMINELSAVAREDSISYARQELAESVERLKQARQILTAFRNRNQIVDPTLDLQSQAGLIGTLQGQLAEAMIEVDLLRETTSASDPRVAQAERRVSVIEGRIAEERRKLGLGTDTEGEAYAELIAEYESLAVEHDFAQRSYVAALAAFDSALAEARRKTRYLAAHILPTTAESARFPRRWMLLGLTALFLSLAWAIGALVAYSLKDRR